MANDKPLSKASDFHPEVLRLFDKYVHGIIDRRGFLDSAARFAVGSVTATVLLDALNPRFAQAEQVPKTDPRIKSESLEFDSPQGNGKARAYMVRPANAAGPLPVVLVVHENRGLNPHIEDIARRLALANFIAFAPDALYSMGGYPGTEDKARELFGKLDRAKITEDFVAAAGVAKAVTGSNGKLGVVGFCYGGNICNELAERVPALAAAVPFYGIAPPIDKVGQIKAELLLNFAESDDRVNASWPPYEAALKAAGVRYQAFTYPGTQHGFNNDTTPRFEQAQAKVAWDRTIALFDRTLRS